MQYVIQTSVNTHLLIYMEFLELKKILLNMDICILSSIPDINTAIWFH